MPARSIEEFKGKYEFLSNFLEYPILYGNRIFDSLEAAYQSEKAVEKRKYEFLGIRANVAKKLGRNQPLPKNWDIRKIGIMKRLLRIKFSDIVLRQKLLDTGNDHLVEGNYWHDNFWGVCTCMNCPGAGDNTLGELLMKVRAEIVDGL